MHKEHKKLQRTCLNHHGKGNGDDKNRNHIPTDDIGFMWSLTSVARYKLLGEEDSKRRALLAANLLAARFNGNGNFIQAWNNHQPDVDKTDGPLLIQ